MKLEGRGTSLVVQWLGLGTSTAGGTGSIPDWRSNILHDKQCSQKKKKGKKKKLEGWAEDWSLVTQGFIGHVTKYPKCSVEALQIDWTEQGISEGEGSVSHFLKKLILILEDNYFTILWWFLPYVDMNQPRVYMCPPILNPLPAPSPPHPSGLSQSTSLSDLLCASNLHWSSVLHMVIYMFQC